MSECVAVIRRSKPVNGTLPIEERVPVVLPPIAPCESRGGLLMASCAVGCGRRGPTQWIEARVHEVHRQWRRRWRLRARRTRRRDPRRQSVAAAVGERRWGKQEHEAERSEACHARREATTVPTAQRSESTPGGCAARYANRAHSDGCGPCVVHPSGAARPMAHDIRGCRGCRARRWSGSRPPRGS